MKAVPKECCQCREAIRLGTEGLAEPEAHLAVCAECRDYARSIRVTTSALRRLAAQPVSPSPALRARWTAAIRADAQRITWERNLLGLVQWCRDFLQHNRRPLFALAPVWFLILLLRLFAASLPDAPAAMVASSPVKVIRQLQAQSQLLAQQLGAPAGKSSTPPKAEPTAPRSQAAPSTRSASTKLSLRARLEDHVKPFCSSSSSCSSLAFRGSSITSTRTTTRTSAVLQFPITHLAALPNSPSPAGSNIVPLLCHEHVPNRDS